MDKLKVFLTAALVVTAIILALIAVGVVLASCAPENRRVLYKYQTQDTFSTPSGCNMATDSTCMQVEVTHFWLAVEYCDQSEDFCQLEFIEVSEPQWEQQEVEQK